MYFLLFLCCYLSAVGAFFTKNSTVDVSKCEVYYSRSGMKYKDFFKVRQKPKTSNDSLVFDFHFSVLAPSDAHILLAPSAEVQKGDHVYEIVIGAGNNAFSDIRRAIKAQVKASTHTVGILSWMDVKSFWIHIDQEGTIEVGKAGEDVAFLNWQDPDLLPINVFSFSTWTGIEAKWFFNCPDDEISSGKLVKEKTDLQRLREGLLYLYNPYIRPVESHLDFTKVSMEFTTHFLSIDERQGTMDLRGLMKMEWKDEKLKWNPSEFGNISALRILRREIWKPDLFILDSLDLDEDPLSDTMMLVTNDGKVKWNPSAHFVVWCAPENLGAWPSESHTCPLELTFRQHHIFMELEFNTNTSEIISPNFVSEWQILEVQIDATYGIMDGTTYKNAKAVQLLFTVKRMSESYHMIFFTPFILIGTLSMLSFWVSPNNYLKIAMSCFQLLLTSLVTIGLAVYMPVHPTNIPYLVLLYSSTLLAVALNVVIATIVINLCRSKHENSLPNIVCRFLNSNVTRFVFLLPKNHELEEYGSLKDSTLMVKTTSVIQEDWILLGTLIDRLTFTVFSGLFVAGVVFSY